MAKPWMQYPRNDDGEGDEPGGGEMADTRPDHKDKSTDHDPRKGNPPFSKHNPIGKARFASQSGKGAVKTRIGKKASP